jgi:aryl-alcohol dehydrogenase-like predicted oxidoreductase
VTPIAETVDAMGELVREGKTRAIGVSNFTLDQLDQAARTAKVAALQNEYSLLGRAVERDVLPRCCELGIGFVPHYPLAGGLLTGKYRRGERPPEGTRLAVGDVLTDEPWATPRVSTSTAQATFDKVEHLEAFARQRGRTLLELSIAALASQPGVASVIPGATSPEQVRANAAGGDWQLTADELAHLPSA